MTPPDKMNRVRAIEVMAERRLTVADPELADAMGYIVDQMRLTWKSGPYITCSHCGEPVCDAYILQDEVWRAAWPTWRGYLHLRCVEARLGRAITAADLKADIPLNAALIYVLGKLAS